MYWLENPWREWFVYCWWMCYRLCLTTYPLRDSLCNCCVTRYRVWRGRPSADSFRVSTLLMISQYHLHVQRLSQLGLRCRRVLTRFLRGSNVMVYTSTAGESLTEVWSIQSASVRSLVSDLSLLRFLCLGHFLSTVVVSALRTLKYAKHLMDPVVIHNILNDYPSHCNTESFKEGMYCI